MSEAATENPVSAADRAKSLGKAGPEQRRLAQVLDRVDVTQADVARAWGVSQQHVSSVLLGRRALKVAHIRALPERARDAYLADLGRETGSAWVKLPQAPDDAPGAMHRAAELAEEHGELMSAWLRAGADGHVTAGEAAEVEREAWDVVYGALGMVALMRLAQDEGVIGIEL